MNHNLIKEKFLEKFNQPQHAPFGANEIADFFASEYQKQIDEERMEIASKLKYKFNGYGGILGFALNELLDLFQSKEEVTNK